LGDSSPVTFTGCPRVPASYRAETRSRSSAGSTSDSQLAIFERSCGSAQRGHRTWEKRCDDSEEKLPPSISKLVETVSPVAGQTKTRTPISHLPELKTSLSNVLGWSGKNLGSDSSVSRLRPTPFSVFEIVQISTFTRCVGLGINQRFGKVTRVPVARFPVIPRLPSLRNESQGSLHLARTVLVASGRGDRIRSGASDVINGISRVSSLMWTPPSSAVGFGRSRCCHSLPEIARSAAPGLLCIGEIWPR